MNGYEIAVLSVDRLRVTAYYSLVVIVIGVFDGLWGIVDAMCGTKT